MGKKMPPLYEDLSLEQVIDKISEIDEKINTYAIEREKYVEAFKEKVKESHTV